MSEEASGFSLLQKNSLGFMSDQGFEASVNFKMFVF